MSPTVSGTTTDQPFDCHPGAAGSRDDESSPATIAAPPAGELAADGEFVGLGVTVGVAVGAGVATSVARGGGAVTAAVGAGVGTGVAAGVGLDFAVGFSDDCACGARLGGAGTGPSLAVEIGGTPKLTIAPANARAAIVKKRIRGTAAMLGPRCAPTATLSVTHR